MSMCNDVDWRLKGNEEVCLQNSSSVAAYAAKLPKGHWSFFRLRSEEKWYSTLAVAELMMIIVRESGIQRDASLSPSISSVSTEQ